MFPKKQRVQPDNEIKSTTKAEGANSSSQPTTSNGNATPLQRPLSAARLQQRAEVVQRIAQNSTNSVKYVRDCSSTDLIARVISYVFLALRVEIIMLLLLRVSYSLCFLTFSAVPFERRQFLCGNCDKPASVWYVVSLSVLI
jgi:hypothetical protein